MCVKGVLVWTWVTDYSVSLCECVLCACLKLSFNTSQIKKPVRSVINALKIAVCAYVCLPRREGRVVPNSCQWTLKTKSQAESSKINQETENSGHLTFQFESWKHNRHNDREWKCYGITLCTDSPVEWCYARRLMQLQQTISVMTSFSILEHPSRPVLVQWIKLYVNIQVDWSGRLPNRLSGVTPNWSIGKVSQCIIK